MGEYPPPGTESQYTLDLILTASNEPTSFFIDLSKGLRAVGTCHRASEGKARLSLPSAKSCYPRSMFFERFYYSRATLEDVTQVLPCRIASVIVGAIFCYRNGTRASLGWVALNQLDAPVTVDTPGLWFLITKFGPGFPKITAICHSPPVTGGQEYFHVQWQGELEWWFSCRQCQLHHNGRQTPMTRM
ncbi:hypothetical protein NOR_00053 [Metarhizium rileyi]|uniref:Uncharacterized protein n=1 Tax=Metarhizium rileyi (strain RCEF 4871) TaxID=1649241 RepID=A0A162M5Z8_METRR|nr:hypothetical protein NOR_00053 [Metarhizium rileyi RCEF 4871]